MEHAISLVFCDSVGTISHLMCRLDNMLDVLSWYRAWEDGHIPPLHCISNIPRRQISDRDRDRSPLGTRSS